MRIGYLAGLLKTGNTSFGEMVGGAAELSLALQGTLAVDMAFVIPLTDRAGTNQYTNEVVQTITERFGIVCVLKNDSTNKDKLGLLAYDQLHNIRSELFRVFSGKLIPEATGVIYYVGGTLKDINSAYLWYQFEFEYTSTINGDELQVTPTDDTEIPTNFDTIYANYILSPSADLPHTGDLPLPDGFPDVTIPDMASLVDLTFDPRQGSYGGGFATAFKTYDEDRRYS